MICSKRLQRNSIRIPIEESYLVSGSELPSSGELGGSPSAAAGGKRGRVARERERPLNQQTGFPCPVTLARPSVTPPAGSSKTAGRIQ